MKIAGCLGTELMFSPALVTWGGAPVKTGRRLLVALIPQTGGLFKTEATVTTFVQKKRRVALLWCLLLSKDKGAALYFIVSLHSLPFYHFLILMVLYSLN